MTKLAIKDELNSNEMVNFYDIDADHFIAIEHTESGRVNELRLVYANDGEVFARFLPNRIIYLEQISNEYEDDDRDYRAIDLDELSYFEDWFTEVI